MELMNLIKKAGIQAVEQGAPVNVMVGTVKQINPLIINVEQRLDLPAECLLLTDAVRDYQTELSFDNPAIKNYIHVDENSEKTLYFNPGSSNETEESIRVKGTIKGDLYFKEKVKHEVTIYNALKVGEKVLLLRVQGGQKYVVLNRLVNAI
ncbi:MAG TPA: DUF2577 domain-containing protein [Defluviitoga tunisiensis]|nr:DUF2577 domain-containing protein [Defluviitoga tunisiensis]